MFEVFIATLQRPLTSSASRVRLPGNLPGEKVRKALVGGGRGIWAGEVAGEGRVWLRVVRREEGRGKKCGWWEVEEDEFGRG